MALDLVEDMETLGFTRFAVVGHDRGARVAYRLALDHVMLVLGALGLVMAPIGNTFSRRLESQADDFALALTGNPAAFIAAMERLGDLNLAERRPHRLKEIALHSHPSLERSIARARVFAQLLTAATPV